jgi:hypothetical protein
MTDPTTDAQLAAMAKAAAEPQTPIGDLVRVTINISPYVGFDRTSVIYMLAGDAEALEATVREKRIM